MADMIVFVGQRNCADYYCGCGGGHIVGVFMTQEEAGVECDTITPIPVGHYRWDTESWRDEGEHVSGRPGWS